MRAPAGGRGCLYAAMLASAVCGRVLDAAALLPGVRETAMVRGSLAGWSTALAVAVVVAAVAARQWSRSGRLRSVAAVVVPGQLVTFFAAEAVVRLANGLGPLDPDGVVGAGLQAALAMLLLLAVTAAWVVVVRATAVTACAPPVPAGPRRRRTTSFRPCRPSTVLLARGPPSGVCT